MHIHGLRAAIDKPFDKPLIQTRHGIGYRMVDPSGVGSGRRSRWGSRNTGAASSRIIISFALFGLALTALFAVSAIYLRGYLEDKLIGETLQQNLQGYADAFYKDPSTPGVPLDKIVGYTIPPEKFGSVTFAWRDLQNGVYDLSEPDGRGGRIVYKLAVRRDPTQWFYLKYDTTQEKRSQRMLEGALVKLLGLRCCR